MRGGTGTDVPRVGEINVPDVRCVRNALRRVPLFAGARPLDVMSALDHQSPSRRRRIVSSPPGVTASRNPPGRDERLEAALLRELGETATDPRPTGAVVEAWARQLGLEGTALLTTHEAAPLLRMCERSVRQGITDGQIPHVRLGRRVFIPVPRLLAMLLDEREPEA
jgi:excisionase family DNA binding protein